MKSRRDWIVLALVTVASIAVAVVSMVCFSDEFRAAPSHMDFFLKSVSGFGWFEYVRILSVVTGIVSVYLAAIENIWVWPIGIVWCLATAWVMIVFRFFGDMLLMYIYFFLQIHGWWSWTHGSEQRTELPIRWAPWRTIALVVVLVAIGIWPSTLFLRLPWVHGAAPFWDSFTTAGSLGAQFLLNRKYIENWIGWLIVDLVYVPVYFVKKLPDQAMVYVVFLVLAVIGLVQWIVLYKNSRLVRSD